MPITLPKKLPAPLMPAPPEMVTAERVQEMLAARDAQWSERLEDMAKRLLSVMVAQSNKVQKPDQKPESPRKPVRVRFEMDRDGMPIGFTITPEK